MRSRTFPLLILLGLLVLAGLAAVVVVSSGALKLSIEELEEKYTTPDSKFAEVDGIRAHYMDQGSGPVVVLLHATLMNLRTWDHLAGALATNYRVIRMDRLLSGLTGADPSKAYSVEREIELMEGLLDELGVDKFSLVGTSSAGTLSFRYAAQHPERVTNLVLINSAGMPRTAATNPNRQRGTWFGRWVRKYYQSQGFWKETLALNFFAPPGEAPDWLVEMVYDTSRKEGLLDQVMIYMRNFSSGDPEAVLAQVRAPTLVLWGMENVTVNHLEAEVFEHWLVNAPVTKKKYPDTGHYLYLEIPEVVAEDIKAFLAKSRQSSTAINPEQAQGERLAEYPSFGVPVHGS